MQNTTAADQHFFTTTSHGRQTRPVSMPVQCEAGTEPRRCLSDPSTDAHLDKTMTTSDAGNERWILDVSNKDRVTDVAARTIRLRLKAVRHFLPLAATRPEEDIEYVHQLRVATRRAVAAIHLYREFLPRRTRKALCRQLKQIRRAAGTARDCDVLLERQAKAKGTQAETALKDLRRKRQHAQEPLREVYRSSMEQGALKQLTRQTLAGVSSQGNRKKSPRFQKWARRQLRETTRAFFAAEPVHLDDLDALHRFRIHVKDLRYAMELLAAAFPVTLRTEIYPRIEDLQDHLGTINDHAVAVARFRRWRDEAAKPKRRKRWKKLIVAEKKQLADSLWGFASWWTPRRSKWIQRRFRQLANGDD